MFFWWPLPLADPDPIYVVCTHTHTHFKRERAEPGCVLICCWRFKGRGHCLPRGGCGKWPRKRLIKYDFNWFASRIRNESNRNVCVIYSHYSLLLLLQLLVRLVLLCSEGQSIKQSARSLWGLPTQNTVPLPLPASCPSVCPLCLVLGHSYPLRSLN